jgi:uncharacterized protein
MTTRRKFIVTSSLATIGSSLSLSSPVLSNILTEFNPPFESNRPPLNKRKFTSEAVEATIVAVKKQIADAELAWMFENCFPNTLDTTVNYSEENGEPLTYVITGDIDAMWLRDSTAQVWPYLPLANKDAKLKNLLKGVVVRQTKFVLLDPYANAFYDNPNHISEWKNDFTTMKPGVHERKWEIDSLCYVIRLAHGYWKQTGDTTIFNTTWQDAMKLIVQTFREQQRKENNGPYRFQRAATSPTDTQFGGGYGNPSKKTGSFIPCSAPPTIPLFSPSLSPPICLQWYRCASWPKYLEQYWPIKKWQQHVPLLPVK